MLLLVSTCLLGFTMESLGEQQCTCTCSDNGDHVVHATMYRDLSSDMEDMRRRKLQFDELLNDMNERLSSVYDGVQALPSNIVESAENMKDKVENTTAEVRIKIGAQITELRDYMADGIESLSSKALDYIYYVIKMVIIAVSAVIGAIILFFLIRFLYNRRQDRLKAQAQAWRVAEKRYPKDEVQRMKEKEAKESKSCFSCQIM